VSVRGRRWGSMRCSWRRDSSGGGKDNCSPFAVELNSRGSKGGSEGALTRRADALVGPQARGLDMPWGNIYGRDSRMVQ